MESITKEILLLLNNNHTKIVEKEDYKGNYYSHITDTIYLSQKEDSKMPTKAKGISRDMGRIVTVCHECIHSVQKKYLHVLNIVLSNLSILLFLTCFFVRVLKETNIILNIITLIVLFISSILRIYLEMDAISGSINLSKKVIDKNIFKNISLEELESAKQYINKHKKCAVLGMIKDKIIMFIAIGVITFI